MSRLTVHWGEKCVLLNAEDGKDLHELLAENGIAVYAPCKGNGTCKKCRVRIADSGGEREVLACRTRVCGDGEVWVPKITGGGLTAFDAALWEGGMSGIGAAIDIGTTTVAAVLVDLSDGRVLRRRAVLNPQHVCGADVISRIAACSEGKLALQTDLIRKECAALLDSLCREQGVARLAAVTVCGNTTMLHLFCGVDPTPIGVAPYTPVFTALQSAPGAEYGLPADRIYVLPSASGYIGSDVICGIVSEELDRGEIRLLADLGTNGELALYNGEALVCASTAAGPALEGANIECGIGGIAGAICAVSCEQGRLMFRTVDDAPAVGICGSGLVDLIAVLLECGVIDESGSFDEDCGHPLCESLMDDRLMLTECIWLSQKDVRQFQLAKAAICAGILTLCGYAGVKPEVIRELCIAGGFGFYLNEKSALTTGLIPAEFAGKLRAIGNSGLSGAVRCLQAHIREYATAAAGSVAICELNHCADFSDRFIESMSFE